MPPLKPSLLKYALKTSEERLHSSVENTNSSLKKPYKMKVKEHKLKFKQLTQENKLRRLRFQHAQLQVKLMEEESEN